MEFCIGLAITLHCGNKINHTSLYIKASIFLFYLFVIKLLIGLFEVRDNGGNLGTIENSSKKYV